MKEMKEMKEFNLNSAEKYKDGSPMMTDLPVQLVRLMKRIELLEKKVRDDNIGKYYTASLKEYIDDKLNELNEKMQAVTKEHIKHEDLIEDHEAKICELEHMYENVIEDMCAVKERLCNITSLITENNKYAHIFSNFCGNCAHCDHGEWRDDKVYVCELSAEIVDPDDSSCSMFEPPF